MRRHALVLVLVLAAAPVARAETIGPPYAAATRDAACDGLFVALGYCTAVSEAGLDGRVVMDNLIRPRLGSGTPVTGRGYLFAETTVRHITTAASSVAYTVRLHVAEALALAPRGAQAQISIGAHAVHATCRSCFGVGEGMLLVSDLGPTTVVEQAITLGIVLTDRNGGAVPAGAVDVVVAVEGTSFMVLVEGAELRLAADLTIEGIDVTSAP